MGRCACTGNGPRDVGRPRTIATWSGAAGRRRRRRDVPALRDHHSRSAPRLTTAALTPGLGADPGRTPGRHCRDGVSDRSLVIIGPSPKVPRNSRHPPLTTWTPARPQSWIRNSKASVPAVRSSIRTRSSRWSGPVANAERHTPRCALRAGGVRKSRPRADTRLFLQPPRQTALPWRLPTRPVITRDRPRPSPGLLTIAARFEAPSFSPAVPDEPQAAVHNGRQRSMAVTGRSRWPRSAAATAANAQLTAVPTGETPRLAAVGSWHCPPRRAPGARLPPAHATGPGAGSEGPGVLPTLRRQRTPWRRREPGC